MAGYVVEVVKTNHIGHAKSIMEELQQLPDVVVVAGGDGTASEVVTGLIRRNKETCPILFLPLGEKSDTASSLMRLNDKSELVEKLTRCMLALIQGRVEHHSVVKYELIEIDHPEHRKPIFGILSFSWGIIKDTEINKEKFWYFGVLKHYISIIVASVSNHLRKSIVANLSSTPACPGCKNCQPFEKNNRWFNVSKLVNPSLPIQRTNQIKEQKLCSSEKYYKINAKQMDITCTQNSEFFTALNTRIVENINSRTDFLINMMKEKEISASFSLESRTIEIVPFTSENQTYYIDGESYDARHVKISVLPNVLKYFS